MSNKTSVSDYSSLTESWKTIWCWWHSGEESLSPFVKICLDSWRFQHPGWRVVVLDTQNLWQYLSPRDLPSSFLDITRKSLQSDIVRLALLAKHGGCYADLSCLALSDCAEAAWQLLGLSTCSLVGFRAPHFISDFVSTWFLVVRARDPLVMEWSRCLNMVMEGRTDDKNVHSHPFFDGIDLHEYFNITQLDACFNSTLWADYLVINITLKAILDRDPEARASFWASAVLFAEGDLTSSPTTWSHATATHSPKGMKFPENELYKMRSLLKEDDKMYAKLTGLPLLKFFNSGSAFAHLARDDMLSSPSVIGRLARQALTTTSHAAAHFARSAPVGSPLLVEALPMPPSTSVIAAVSPPSVTGTEAVHPSRSVVATLVTNKFFAVGAICLAKSLRQHGRLLPGTGLVCLVPDEAVVGCDGEDWVPWLQAEGWQLLPVEDFSREEFPELFEDLENPNYRHCFKKLYLWDLARRLDRPLDRVLYIDADAVVVGCLRHALYSRECEPPSSGVSMCPDYDWRAGRAARTSHPMSKHAADAVAAAAFKSDSYCNAGVLLLRPSAGLYMGLMRMLHSYRSRGLAEQDFLHDVFTSLGRTKALEQDYNAQKWIRICAPEVWGSYGLKIIHYNNAKPWALRGALGVVEASFDDENAECPDLVRLWHRLYEFSDHWHSWRASAALALSRVPWVRKRQRSRRLSSGRPR